MKKKNSKNNNEQVFQSGEVMSLLENMNEGIQLISEQHTEVIKRLDKLDGRVDKLDGRVDKLESRFDGLESRFDKMQDDVTEIKHRLSEKVDRDEFNKMEKRMIKLEKLVFSKL